MTRVSPSFRVGVSFWRLGSCLSTAAPFKMNNLDQCTFQKIQSLSTEGAHSRVLAYIASPTSPLYVGKQLTALFHTQPLLNRVFSRDVVFFFFVFFFGGGGELVFWGEKK